MARRQYSSSSSSTSPFSLVVFIMFSILASTQQPAAAAASLKVGFYKSSCPSVEAVVRRAVTRAVSRDPGLGAGIIRMHFHDCFVRGCDGSVLLKSEPGGKKTERDHPANNPTLRGFEPIDEAKSNLESICPNTVSCADILAFAARDSSFHLGRITYAVPAGRRDGRISLFDDIPANLPPPSFTAAQLAASFARKGLTADDMVALSGAHSIGVAHCSSFSARLYSFNATHAQDPLLDGAYAAELKRRCPVGGGGDVAVGLDATPDRLDGNYYGELRKGRGLLSSDQTLMESALTKKRVVGFASGGKGGGAWAGKFAKAMVKMGAIEVLTGSRGEIRKRCDFVN
ncbi:unnamed protein product [Linum trigynum]|uniref:Peroxidase n=1 Tax=Linum trigynum TaxID=586398 RepID=A0AAV2D309_9ROSI